MSEKHTPKRWTPGPCRLVWTDDRHGEIQGGTPEDLVALFEVCDPEEPEIHEQQIEAVEFLLSAPDLLVALEQAPEPPSLPANRDRWTDIYLEWTVEKYLKWLRLVRAAALAKVKA